MTRWFMSLRHCWQRLRCREVDPEKTQVIHCESRATVCVSRQETQETRLAPSQEQRTVVELSSHAEKRQNLRYPVDHEVVCRRPGSRNREFTILGRARNLSSGGLGLVIGCTFPPGTILLVEVNREDEPPSYLRVQVVHARPLRYRGWFLGCAFLQTLTEQELQTLL